MNNEKIKIDLSPDELKALFTLLNSVNFDKMDKELKAMTYFILKKVYMRVATRLTSFFTNNKNYKLSLHHAEAVALNIAFCTLNVGQLGKYENNLILKIQLIVNQKTA